eukprot:3941923-Rhodomonas_salina.1
MVYTPLARPFRLRPRAPSPKHALSLSLFPALFLSPTPFLPLLTLWAHTLPYAISVPCHTLSPYQHARRQLARSCLGTAQISLRYLSTAQISLCHIRTAHRQDRSAYAASVPARASPPGTIVTPAFKLPASASAPGPVTSGRITLAESRRAHACWYRLRCARAEKSLISECGGIKRIRLQPAYSLYETWAVAAFDFFDFGGHESGTETVQVWAGLSGAHPPSAAACHCPLRQRLLRFKLFQVDPAAWARLRMCQWHRLRLRLRLRLLQVTFGAPPFVLADQVDRDPRLSAYHVTHVSAARDPMSVPHVTQTLCPAPRTWRTWRPPPSSSLFLPP